MLTIDVHAGVLAGVSLCYPEDGLFGITGPSGVGKTTLLHALGGLLDMHTNGEVLYNDQSLGEFSRSEMRRYRSEIVGYAALSGTLLDNLTGKENIALKSKLSGTVINEKLLEDAITKLEMSIVIDQNVETMSSGQRERCAYLTAIAYNPPVLLIDEPGASLDSLRRKVLYDLIQAYAKNHLVIAVTHDEDFLALVDDRHEMG